MASRRVSWALTSLMSRSEAEREAGVEAAETESEMVEAESTRVIAASHPTLCQWPPCQSLQDLTDFNVFTEVLEEDFIQKSFLFQDYLVMRRV